ncbi:radical SAM protein [Streptomyces sp. NPDC088766]|uniref:radical SAM protein n=1 Tax=Streptomyces sp. NPDC088766 TaxID=3365893 RepID=UPI0038052B3C
MLRAADGLIELGPDSIAPAGGEPLLVKEVFEVAERLALAGIEVILHTGGRSLEPWMTGPVARLFSRVSVSVDGGTPETHDRLRGRAGSYDRAVRALGLLAEAARHRRATHGRNPWLGIDYVVVRANFSHPRYEGGRRTPWRTKRSSVWTPCRCWRRRKPASARSRAR